MTTYAEIEINHIIPNPEQPRVDFNARELAALAQSIEARQTCGRRIPRAV